MSIPVLSPRSYEDLSSPGRLLLARVRMAEGRVGLMRDQLIEATQRNAELKLRTESLRSTLKRCRQSRDGWKTRAQTYLREKQLLRQRLYYMTQQRDLWKYRALRAEVEKNPTPHAKGHLTRVSVKL